MAITIILVPKAIAFAFFRREKSRLSLKGDKGNAAENG